MAREQLTAITELLDRYSGIFEANPKKPNAVKGAQHSIITGEALPIKHNSYPVSPTTENEINRQVEEMLHNGICRPSYSPWASRVLLVTKRDGSKRFVIDYRALNQVTQTDGYPMPNPRDLLDRFQGDKYFTMLDCARAYWAIKIREEDQHKTAFVCPRGLFEMIRIPFDLLKRAVKLPATYGQHSEECRSCQAIHR